MIDGCDFMFDLETLGVNPRAPILTIGAVHFRASEAAGVFRGTFYKHVDLQSSLDAGLVPDGSTFYWWLEQKKTARRELYMPAPRERLLIALTNLSVWMREVAWKEGCRDEPHRIWGHGASFDPVLLESSYLAVNVEKPWRYSWVRDTRTLFEAAGMMDTYSQRMDEILGKNRHIALNDAGAQAMLVQEAWAKFHPIDGYERKEVLTAAPEGFSIADLDFGKV